MCGIAAFLASQSRDLSKLKSRGPDMFGSVDISTNERKNVITMAGAVLAYMRGDDDGVQCPQPVVDAFGNVLLFNGEIFAYQAFEETISSTSASSSLSSPSVIEISGIEQSVSDTRWLSESLAKLDNRDKPDISFVPFLETLRGPWALIYYDKGNESLIFGRDHLGRRSLCCSKELTARIDLHDNFALSSIIIPRYGIDGHAMEEADTNDATSSNGSKKIKQNDDESWLEIDVDCIFRLHIPSGAVQRYLREPPFLASSQQSTSLIHKPVLAAPLQQLISATPEERFFAALDLSVKRRCINRIGVLFSGGLDSVVLAALANRHVPKGSTIELVNVSFDEENNYRSSDRESAEEALLELQTSNQCKDRDYKLICVNIPRTELINEKEHIISLIKPRQKGKPVTIMDFNLGSSLYFASHYISNTKNRVLFSGLGADELLGGYRRHETTFKRSGGKNLPAEGENIHDEEENLKKAEESLRAELLRDILRLHERNLGRDDRIISDAGREVRQPFLDIDVVLTLQQLPLDSIVDFRLKPGEGDKMILRKLAHSLGLPKTATRIKRAMQFGTKISKIVGGKGGEDEFSASSSIA